MRLLFCLLLIFQLMACAVVPSREILPFPEHIRAGVDVGDKVTVVTSDGDTIELVVTELTPDSLGDADRSIDFEDISTLSKRSLAPVKNPCDDGRRLGCSIPLAVTVFSEYYASYGNEFREPCTSHDFCYAYGLRTYGHDKQTCDLAFLEDMQTLCLSKNTFDIVGRADCLLAAEQMHAAVQGFGDEHFRRESSEYCEYAGPT